MTDEGVGLLEPEDGRGQKAEVDSEGAAGGRLALTGTGTAPVTGTPKGI